MADALFDINRGIHVKGANSIIEGQLLINDNLTVNASVMLISGNLSVTGNLTYSNTSLAGDLIPSIPGSSLGNTTNRFLLFATDIDASGFIKPTVTNGSLGDTNLRWFVYSSNTDVQNVLTANNLIVSTNLVFANSTTRKVGINAVPSGTAALQIGGDASATGNVTAVAFVGASVNLTGNTIAVAGAQLTSNSATVAVTSTPQLIDSFPKTLSKLAKYNVRVANTTTGIQGAEILLVHEGTNVLMTSYAETYNALLGSFDGQINGANVELTYTGTAGETVRLLRTQVLE